MKNGDLDADNIFNRLLIGYVHNVGFLILGTLSKLRPGYVPSAYYPSYWTLPDMSQPDFPEHFPFALDASFLPSAHGLVCLKPRKVSEAARFRPIPLVYLGSQGVQFNYPQRQRAGIALVMTF